MRRIRIRMLFALTTIVSIVWFKNHPVIRFPPAQDAGLTFPEMTANVLVASTVAVVTVIAVTSIGRAMGWWKDE